MKMICKLSNQSDTFLISAHHQRQKKKKYRQQHGIQLNDVDKQRTECTTATHNRNSISRCQFVAFSD